MVDRPLLDRITERIVQQFNPSRVILFGSYARNEASENSDVDLMVLFDEPPPWGKGAVPIYHHLHDAFLIPFDIIVRTTDSFNRNRTQPGTLAEVVGREGIVLYAGK